MTRKLGMSNAATNLHVPAGKDLYQNHNAKIWGLIPINIKVSSADSGGAFFVFQHNNMGKGGPPRHIHFAQDEWFYAVAGEFIAEIGDKRYVLKPGDSLFAPRMIAHAWACCSNTPGTIITAVSPAGTFEQFIVDTTKYPTLPPQADIEKAFEDHNMKIVGPPLKVD